MFYSVINFKLELVVYEVTHKNWVESVKETLVILTEVFVSDCISSCITTVVFWNHRPYCPCFWLVLSGKEHRRVDHAIQDNIVAVLHIVSNVVDDLNSVFGIGIPRTFLFGWVEVCV